MEIKRTQSGQAAWSRTADTSAAGKTDAARPELPDVSLESKAESAAMRAIGAEFKRADLNTDKWQAILRRSIDALLESTTARTGALPPAARQQITDILGADPIFSRRVYRYWEKNLS
jgi:hypothetical protein